MYKKLENLHKLLSVLYPDNTEQVFYEKLQDIFKTFMFHKHFEQSQRNPLLYIEKKYKFSEPVQYPQQILELFEQSKRIRLLKKPLKTLCQRYDLIKTMSIIAEYDEDVQMALDKECNEIKQEIRRKSKEKQLNTFEKTAAQNNAIRGDFYTGNDAYATHPRQINFDKICLVHTTRHYPGKNKDRQYFIDTTAHATQYISPRPTVHFTCNHIVQEHWEGAPWSLMPYVIIAPFNDLVKINGAPRRFGMVDTYFLPDQESGVVLPESVMIVEPADADKMSDTKLYIIAPNNHVYYRTKNFSDQMKKALAGKDWKKVTDTELMVMSKQLATEKIMKLNGFNYLHGNGGSINDDNELHSDFFHSGNIHGFWSSQGNDVHANDPQTFLSGQYDDIIPIIKRMIDGQPIYIKPIIPKEIVLDRAKKWLKEHIIQGEPIQELEIFNNDLPQITDIKQKFNQATQILIKELKQKITTEEDINKFLSQVSIVKG